MLEIGGGNDDGIDVLTLQQVLKKLEGARRAAIRRRGARRAFAIDTPEVADGCHFDVRVALEPGDHGGQFPSARADPDVSERDAVVGSLNPRIGEGSRSGCRGAPPQECCG